MNVLTKILIKILLFFIGIIGLAGIYKVFFFESDLKKYSDILELVREVQDSSEIIYIGESSNFTARADDIDKRSISNFIADYYPSKNFGTINKGALHAGIYKVLLEQIPENSNVETVIVTLNLRSFNANWIYSDLETALQKSIVLLKPFPALYNRFLLSFKGYDIKTKKERETQFKRKWKKDSFNKFNTLKYANVIEWDKAMAKNGINNENGIKDWKLTELACHYIKTYAFEIDTSTNPRIKDFDAIVALAEKRGWNLVFNLMAENVEKAEQLVGTDIVNFIKYNNELLVDRYSKKGVVVVDNYNAVRDELYIDQHWTTEHYAEEGRKKIAKNVADSMVGFYSDRFRLVEYKTDNFNLSFYNNCDDNLVWGQMHTITDESSFSGAKSSKTGGGTDYSITFEQNLTRIPDSLFNAIEVDLKLFFNQMQKDAKIVVEAKGKHMEPFWNGVSLAELKYLKGGEWNSVNYIFQIPERIKNADVTKVYLYNPTSEGIFVDNLKITLKNIK